MERRSSVESIKIFKKLLPSTYKFALEAFKYNRRDTTYSNFISSFKKQGYEQVIINSEIMIWIIEESLKHKMLITKINLSEFADEEEIEVTGKLISKVNLNNVYWIELKNHLNWVSDSNSIDIKSISIYDPLNSANVNSEIGSSGLIQGKSLFLIFEQIVKPVIEVYLNGK